MDTSIVIMAAGRGSRMQSDTPKVLHKICGKSMIEHVLDCVWDLSDDICVVLHHQADRIKEALHSCDKKKISFYFQDLDNFPGTAGALMRGKNDSSNPKGLIGVKHPRVLILNADMPLISVVHLKKILSLRARMALVTLRVENPNGYGRIILQKGSNSLVQRVLEDKDCSELERGINLVNAGVYLCEREILSSLLPGIENQNSQNEYYLVDIVELANKRGIDVHSIQMPFVDFMGVNSKKDLSIAEGYMLERLRNEAMDRGVFMQLPESIYLDCDVQFSGECVLENGCSITGKSILKNAYIRSHSIIEDSIIEDSSIGPIAHIRPGCVIKRSHVGNFVEAKAAVLDGVKAGHLSYLGDCEIGRGSNIGAGVITCNYDGKRKHRTIIGENVFVGSDCQLIAPLKIESNVLIAAGSSVKRDAKSGDLVIARSDQRNIHGGFYKFFQDKE